MSARQVAAAWIAALALVGIAVALFLRAAPQDSDPFRNAHIAVIGSSMLKYAVPASGSGSDSLLGDGRTHRRIGISLISESEVAALGHSAIDAGAQIMFIEAGPLLFNFATSPQERECDNGQSAVRAFAKRQHRLVGDAFRRSIGLPGRLDGNKEPADLFNRQKVTADAIARTYPVHFRALSCRAEIVRMVARARAKGTRIVLVLPPRSVTGQAHLGSKQGTEMLVQARRLAEDLGVEVFIPAGPWSDAEFIDLGHMNARGRQHFRAELQQWRQGAR